MALARVVTFDGVDQEQIERMRQEMGGGPPPVGFPPLHPMAVPRNRARSD